ncbi:hypothetical protein PQR02_32840 [Paraburkholderia sediminicola]|uniref:Uncharacterized protein n=1 Tax=Paraburkholderia rhynchosiae TaxID=487049 RepID=A0ACC7NJM0_9BURK
MTSIAGLQIPDGMTAREATQRVRATGTGTGIWLVAQRLSD